MAQSTREIAASRIEALEEALLASRRCLQIVEGIYRDPDVWAVWIQLYDGMTGTTTGRYETAALAPGTIRQITEARKAAEAILDLEPEEEPDGE